MSRPSRRSRRRPLPGARWLAPVGVVVVAAAIAAVVMLRWEPGRDLGTAEEPPAPPEPTLAAPPFDAARAFVFVEQQVAYGPRVPGTAAHDATRAWLVRTLGSLADRVVEQAVVVPLATGDTLRGTNIVASWGLDAGRRVMLAAHWDSRPTADADPDPSRRAEPVLGANDGGSGVAVLLEMAHLFREYGVPGPAGVDVVLFDLEDLGTSDPSVPDSLRIPYAVGSAVFVRDNPSYRPEWGVLLDMVGDADLQIPKEGYSAQYAPQVVERVWAAARRAGADAFVDRLAQPVEDDHVPFLRAGIPVVDLIHIPFPDTWHTTRDVPEHMSPESLGQVGRVLVELLWGGEA